MRDREKQRLAQKRHYLNNKEKYKESLERNRPKRERKIKRFIFRYKKFCGCKHCGNKNPTVLQFHHVDPTKKDFNVTDIRAGGLARIKEEIRKCIVLCANCHLLEHERMVKYQTFEPPT